MEPSLEAPADVVAPLRRSLNDLVSITALPALWAGAEPPQIVGTLLDALREMLPIAFMFARLKDPESGAPIEMVRLGAPLRPVATAHAIGEMLDLSLGTVPSEWPRSARVSIGGADLGVACARLGLHGEMGVVVAGCQRHDFPGQSERLLLDVAANQAATGLHQAYLLSEQRRVARELDHRVERRTRELADVNEELAREVAERRRAETAARESERQLRLIVDNIPGLVALLMATGELQVVNRQLLEYFGQTVEALSQWGTTDAVHPEDLSHVIEVFTRSVESGTPYLIVQRFRRYDGVYRWFENSGFPVRDPQGRITRWCVLLTDIDERKRAEEALNTARSELAHVTRVSTVSALTASIAHEVNQPLSGIITNASTCVRMLDADPPNVDGARETARRTIRDGRRASDVIARLRALFSKKELALELMDLNEAIREVLALSVTDLQANRVMLRSELADNLPPITGDRVQLQQVILNLLRNASEAMADVDDRPRDLLITSKREDGDFVRVTVRDSGVGIAPANVDKLFDSFYTTKYDGMGIGLSVSRSIIDRHHGHLWVEQNDGTGATFAFSMPVPRSATGSSDP